MFQTDKTRGGGGQQHWRWWVAIGNPLKNESFITLTSVSWVCISIPELIPTPWQCEWEPTWAARWAQSDPGASLHRRVQLQEEQHKNIWSVAPCRTAGAVVSLLSRCLRLRVQIQMGKLATCAIVSNEDIWMNMWCCLVCGYTLQCLFHGGGFSSEKETVEAITSKLFLSSRMSKETVAKLGHNLYSQALIDWDGNTKRNSNKIHSNLAFFLTTINHPL